MITFRRGETLAVPLAPASWEDIFAVRILPEVVAVPVAVEMQPKSAHHAFDNNYVIHVCT